MSETKRPADMTDEELGTELARLGDGKDDATEVIQEIINRTGLIAGIAGAMWRVTGTIMVPKWGRRRG